MAVSSGAAQSVRMLAETLSSVSAEQPDEATVWTKPGVFANYNVGWQYTDRKRTAVAHRVFVAHPFHAMGISEIFEIYYSSTVEHAQINVERQTILKVILNAFNDGAAQPVWEGRQDEHCLYIWQTSLNCVKSTCISLGVEIGRASCRERV